MKGEVTRTCTRFDAGPRWFVGGQRALAGIETVHQQLVQSQVRSDGEPVVGVQVDGMRVRAPLPSWIDARAGVLDERACSSQPALGIDGQTSHAASAMAVKAAENALDEKAKFPFYLIPRGTWTFPEVASVGLTEEQAENKDLDIDVGYFPYSINGYAIARNETFGAVKIVTDAEYRIIYGVHIVGPHATELIGEAVLALLHNAHILAEPSGAASLAALLFKYHPKPEEKVAVIISGANISIDYLASLLKQTQNLHRY